MIEMEIQIPNINTNNNIHFVNGNMTLNEIEKKIPKNDFIFDRGNISIGNLNKTLFELQKEFFQNSHLKFYLLRKCDKLIKNLEESEINFKILDSQFAYNLHFYKVLFM